MAFGQFLRKAHGSATKFFNTTLPTATRNSVRYMNTHIVPFARNTSRVIKAIGNEVTSNETIPEKVRQKVKTASDFADLGLSKLESVQHSTNNIARNLGLD